MATFHHKNVNKPAPVLWSRISTSVRYFLVSIIGLISATDLIPERNVKLTVLIMSGTIMLLKSIDLGLGVSEETPTNETN